MSLRHFIAFILGVCLLPSLLPVSPVAAQSGNEIEKLRNEINERGSKLADIEAEIAKFESELKVVGSEKKTLQSAINQLELERKKIQAEISRTENLITSTDLEISKLILEIRTTEREIKNTESAIAEIIRSQYKNSDESMIELLLQHQRLSEFWNTIEAHDSIHSSMAFKVSELSSFQRLLEEQRDSNTTKRKELVSLKSQYNDQNSVLVNNQSEQTKLLEVTKSEEQNYQQLLANRQEARAQILKELREYESKLQFFLDPNTIPPPGTPVFDWPLKDVIVTQLFGGTEFAARNAAAYGGRPYHSGVDFGAPRGTPIYAPLSGTVRATGNTDAVPGCYSWGQWTLIDHANGLSTLYAHQNVISVVAGQRVNTGDIIGYVGSTGFSTGPHLHFTLYAKDGVSVRKFNEIKTITSCGPATTPVAATEAYIDPMLYLPPPSNIRFAL